MAADREHEDAVRRPKLLLLSGALLGATFGALPGLGGIIALAVSLPFTYGMEPILAMFLYAGIISSVTFGGSIPAILLNTPGTAQNATTCFDGYPMTQRGEAARAIAISATSCFVGSVGGAIVTISLLPVIKPIVFAFGPPEFFWLVLFGLVLIAFAARGSMIKGLAGGGLGIMLSLIGYSELVGTFRYTLGSDYLWDGIPLIPLIVGLFAVSELIIYSARGGTTVTARVAEAELSWQRQTLQGIRDVLSRPVKALRAAGIGAGIGQGMGIEVDRNHREPVGRTLQRHPVGR